MVDDGNRKSAELRLAGILRYIAADSSASGLDDCFAGIGKEPRINPLPLAIAEATGR